MKQFLATYHKHLEWGLGGLVVVTAILAWVGEREVGEETLTIYDIFPPLGLIAFGLMWTHFVMGALRRWGGIKPSTVSAYKTVSFGLVLGLIILHPTLLWLGLFRDGYGLPPLSHLMAYESQALFVSLGVIGLMIFLAYELRQWFGKKKWWKWVEWAQILGMGAIFIHAIELGAELREDWYMALWWFYGITLVAAIIYSEVYKWRKRNDGTKKV